MKRLTNRRFLFCLIALIMTAATTYGQVAQDCGALDCPGRCGRFIDQNGDGFCDRGRLSKPAKVVEPEVVATPTPVEEAATQVKEQTQNKTQDKVQAKTENKTAERTTVSANDNEPAANVTATENPVEESATEEAAPEAPAKVKSPYSLILLTALTLGLYLISAILVKANVWKKATHRKVWNVLLLITGLVSCLLGFFLVIQINYNLKMEWLWTVKLYHVQFGIAMTLIMVIHILWHMNYWKSIFKAKKQ